MELITILLFVWLICIQTKNQDYEKAIKILTKRVDNLTLKLNLANKNIEKILPNENIQPQKNEEMAIKELNISPQNNTIKEEPYYDEDEYYEEYEDEEDYTPKIKEKTITRTQNKNSLENFFFGNAFTIIGAIALIIAVGLFIKLISPFFIFTPLMKTIIGFIFGLALIKTSYTISTKDNLKKYSEVLLGTGFSALFITTLCTTILFKTFSPVLCIIIGTSILLMAYFVADKQKTISMITISLIGGYLNIIFIPEISINWTFGYIIFLNLLSLIYVYRNSKMEWINITNLIITLFLTIIIMLINGQTNNINIAYPITLWGIYLIYDLFKANKINDFNKPHFLNWVNLGILTVFSLIIFNDEKLYIGATLTGTAIIYNIIVGYFVMKGSEKFKPYLYSLLITILLCVYFLSEGILRIAIWSLIGLIIALVTSKLKKDYLAKWTLVFFTPAITNLLFIDGITNSLINYSPIFNNRLLAFSYPIISTFSAYLLMNKSTDKNTLKIAQILKFIAISISYLYFVFEMNNYINANKIYTHTMQALPFVIVGFIYTLQMKKFAISNNHGLFNIASYIVGTLSLLTLLICGFTYKPINTYIPVLNIRFITYITAIGSSILFARWTKLEFFKYLATILGFGLITFEAIDFINKSNNESINYIISLIWLLYAGIITTIGILKNKSYLKNIGIIISLLTLFRIFIHDLRNIEAIYKLIIFMVLGTIFMLISYIYNKNKK